MKNDYEILQVAIGSTQEEIKKSYRKLSSKIHPDKNPGKDTTKEMQELNSAYDRLMNNQLNPINNQFQHTQQSWTHSAPFSDIFSNIDIQEIIKQAQQQAMRDAANWEIEMRELAKKQKADEELQRQQFAEVRKATWEASVERNKIEIEQMLEREKTRQENAIKEAAEFLKANKKEEEVESNNNTQE